MPVARGDGAGGGAGAGAPLLEVRDLHTYYGNIHVLKGISLHIDQGEIVTLIGANGAGKTTTLRTISGLVRPRSGTVTLEGRAIEAEPPHRIVERGISQSPEGRRVFPRMTVQENLEMGAYLNRRPAAEDLEAVYALFPVLKERAKQAGGTLSGGEQQMLAIGRALMARPRVLLLDEPSLGLAPMMVQRIFETIQQINQEGATILLVEQNAHMALRIAGRAYVLETGSIVLEGAAEAIARDPMVQKAYLGLE